MKRNSQEVVVKERILKPFNATAAIYSFLALVISLIALVIALHAQARSNNARHDADVMTQKVHILQDRIDNYLGAHNTAAPGPGSGPNTPQPVPANNALPNGNGQ